MNILLLGGGGREHAMAWKLAQSPHCDKLYIAPGNPGTASCGTNVELSLRFFKPIGDFCLENDIDMVVPGSEAPLVEGIVDYFKDTKALKHIPVIGPTRAGAMLEGSKAFAKAFMQRHNIPTAKYREFDDQQLAEAKEYIEQHPLPIVVKADGLAAGKGVVICHSPEAAILELDQMILGAKFGEASKKVVIEEFLNGVELSVFILTDGSHYCVLPEAKDYKRILEGDKGLNTGGMGAVSPVPFADDAFMKKVEDRIIKPTVGGLQEEDIDYKGFIFLGLINVKGEPYVIEYNCRMGDPETQVVMPRLENDLVEMLEAVRDESIDEISIAADSRAAATVIVVSGGYPEKYARDKEIKLPEEMPSNALLFHAGTIEKEGKLLTHGGRVMAITTLAENISSAVAESTRLAGALKFENKYFRRDIGHEFLSDKG